MGDGKVDYTEIYVVETQDGTMFDTVVTGFFQCSEKRAKKLRDFDNGKCSQLYHKFYTYEEAIAFMNSFEDS